MFYLFIYYYMYIVSVIHMWEWPTYVLSSPVFVFFSYVHLRYYRKTNKKNKKTTFKQIKCL